MEDHLAAESEIRDQWIAIITLELNRDWTWDGLQDRSFGCARTPDAAERRRPDDLRFAVNELALLSDDAQFPDRRATPR
jgi:hypothetical protein